jgi:hypothetical protein
MSHKTKFIIMRSGEATWAEVTAMVNDPLLVEEEPFLEALKRAITNWVKTTPEGKKAWLDSSRDFNVGDLSFNSHDPQLVEYLKAEGIEELAVDPYNKMDLAEDWVYDTVLVNEQHLED